MGTPQNVFRCLSNGGDTAQKCAQMSSKGGDTAHDMCSDVLTGLGTLNSLVKVSKGKVRLPCQTYTHTDLNMNAGVALAQVEFWPSWVSSWGQAN